MAAARRINVPEPELALYQSALERLAGEGAKSNFGSAYTAVNGNMWSMISKYGVVGLRLPSDERKDFIAKYEAELFRGDPAWPPAKEFVAVPAALLERTDELVPLLRRSLEYTRTLKPKPTRAARESAKGDAE